MKQPRIVHATILSLLLIATAGFGYAQHGDNDNGRGKQDKHAQPSNGQQHGKQQQKQQDRGQQQHNQQQQAARPQQQRMQSSPRQNNWQQYRASKFDSQHQTWTQRGGYRGERIPEANFHRSFGRGHSFHIFGLPYMEMGGRPRFQYGGYWFTMMEPYPEYWGASWYQNDDMYVDYNDGGYYLYDHRYPRRPGVAISISF